MAITEADIKLLASERMTDDPDGGGFMTTSVIPDDVENNVFPDLSDADRTFGRVQLRKVYCAVTSEDQDAFLGAHAIIDVTPADPAVTALMVMTPGYAQERADVAQALRASGYQVGYVETQELIGFFNGFQWRDIGSYPVTTVAAYRVAEGPYSDTDDEVFLGCRGPNAVTYWNGEAYVTKYTYDRIKPGSVLGFVSANKGPDGTLTADMMTVRVVKEVLRNNLGSISWYSPRPASSPYYFVGGGAWGGGETYTLPKWQGMRVKLSRPLGRELTGAGSPSDNFFDFAVELRQTSSDGTEAGLAFFGQTRTTAALVAGATVLPVRDTWAQVVPVGDEGGYPIVPEEVLGIDAAKFTATGGRVPVFFRGQAIVLHHTGNHVQTVTGGQTVTLWRDRLSKVQVFGADGVEITAGWTADLVAGTVTFSSVSGYSQPVTIKHRIEDMRLVDEVWEDQITVTRALTHDFPTGSKVSSVLFFGDLQSKVHDGFPQATWDNVFRDTLWGSEPSADFDQATHPITTNNAGAISERWAVVFTNATSFKVIGEQVGEVVPASAGNTGSDCAPLNPATGQPYFTIPSVGWGTGWAAGNVYRFDTTGANVPIWLIRSTAPSDPFDGPDKFTVALRGNVDAP